MPVSSYLYQLLLVHNAAGLDNFYGYTNAPLRVKYFHRYLNIGTIPLESSKLSKNLDLDDPILLPVPEDLPFIARPFSKEELEAGERMAQRYHLRLQHRVGPVQFIGTEPTLNEATDRNVFETSKT